MCDLFALFGEDMAFEFKTGELDILATAAMT